MRIGNIAMAMAIALMPNAYAQAQDGLVGEWSLNADLCDQGRFSFTADGKHESWSRANGTWTRMDSAAYRRQGDLVLIDHSSSDDRLQIVALDGNRLLLRNVDEGAASSGADIEFVRCPSR